MNKHMIDVKEITPSPVKSQVHKHSQDRFNPKNRIYVRASKGNFQQLRFCMNSFFLLLFTLTPWIPFGDRQAILFDLHQQQFHFFGITLFPQDFTLFACFLVFAAVALFFVTTFLGRVWCGYLCPQTVWTFIFMWFEEKLEGTANKRRKQDNSPLTLSLFFRKTLKHSAWLTISLLTALTFVGYFLPINALLTDFFAGESSGWVYFWVIFFALCTYGNAGWMRAIMCVHICPYARFQSVMFDKDTFIVGYDNKRGEKRGPRPRHANAHAMDLGDCIDCQLCVHVCPTGIDIRDGLQYECINCGACIDACDNTMRKMNYPLGLIRYTTQHQLEDKKQGILRPKLLGYGAITLATACVFFYLMVTLSPMQFDVIRDRTQLFRINNEGWIENTYTFKILNKRQTAQWYEINVIGLPTHTWYGKTRVRVQAGEMLTLPISLAMAPDALKIPITPITFILKNEDKSTETIETESRFISQS